LLTLLDIGLMNEWLCTWNDEMVERTSCELNLTFDISYLVAGDYHNTLCLFLLATFYTFILCPSNIRKCLNKRNSRIKKLKVSIVYHVIITLYSNSLYTKSIGGSNVCLEWSEKLVKIYVLGSNKVCSPVTCASLHFKNWFDAFLRKKTQSLRINLWKQK